MKNSIHYSKQKTAKAIRVIATLASLGQQTSHSLQSLCFAPCNVIYYFLLAGHKIDFIAPFGQTNPFLDPLVEIRIV